MTVELLAVYTGLALLGGLLVVDGGRDWRLRGAAIVVAPLLAFALWQAAQPPRGWPTTARTPRQATFLWGAIREPDPQTGDPGRVFIWADIGSPQPRAYSLPYTRRLHRQVQAAIGQTKHGHTVTVTRQQAGRRGQRIDRLRFYPHPPVRLPAKETP